LRLLAPEAADAYRTFAIHNADTETGYRRDESWETETFTIDNYTPAQFDALKAEFAKVAAAGETMRAKADNELLLAELDPWLTEFTKLGNRGLRTLDLIASLSTDTPDSLFWTNYVGNLMSEADRAAYMAHKTGTMKLQPFYENAMDAMLVNFYEKVSGERADTHKGIGSYPNLRTILSKLMLDGDVTNYYTSARSQSEGDWIGVDMGRICPVHEVTVLQGRNSVDDVDYFDHAILEASADGNSWTALSDSLVKIYEVRYSGEPVDARYVRLRRLPSAKTNWASVREFTVNPPSVSRIGLDIVAADATEALKAFDSNPATIYASTGTLSFSRKPETNGIIILAEN
ncbi:MAG: discoidin domain-containing protein, partial [Muribaculaceae bacterium]|nr:discoidin domain-containing protein [Muribaculaceae bacterium]